MIDTNIIPVDTAKSTYYTDVARALRQIAAALIDAEVDAVNGPALVPATYGVRLSILPSTATEHTEDRRVATVDAIATAVLDKAGRQEPSGSGWHHIAHGDVGPVDVSIHTATTGPAPDEVQAELLRLRAENEALRRELADDEDAMRASAFFTDVTQ